MPSILSLLALLRNCQKVSNSQQMQPADFSYDGATSTEAQEQSTHWEDSP